MRRKRHGKEECPQPLQPVVVPLKDWSKHEEKAVEEIERSEHLTAKDLAVRVGPCDPQHDPVEKLRKQAERDAGWNRVRKIRFGA